MSLLAGKTPEEIQAFFDGPASKPPHGVIPNFANPDDMNSTFIILCVSGTLITGLCLAMRFYTSWTLTRKFILEDFILLSGWVIYVTGINTCIYQATRYHLGVHQWDIQVKNLVTYFHLFHYGTLLFCITMLLLRIAIIMQVLRHFVPPGVRNFTFWASHALICANTVFWLAVTLMELLSCHPRHKLWEFYLDGKCMDRHAYLIASSVMNLGSEILIMALPVRIIWKLSLSTKQKLELTPLFVVGTLTCICSGIRLWQTVAQWPTHDLSFYIADAIMVWTVPEIACSVLVPCLPSFPQFLHILRRKFGSSKSSSSFLDSSLIPPQRAIIGGNEGQKSERTRVTDVEYHELVVRRETTVDSTDREDAGPWVQPPTTVQVRGGRGPTKVFSAPVMFTRP